MTYLFSTRSFTVGHRFGTDHQPTIGDTEDDNQQQANSGRYGNTERLAAKAALIILNIRDASPDTDGTKNQDELMPTLMPTLSLRAMPDDFET